VGLALNVLAALVFVVWPELPGLLLARVVSGLGVGVVTATATATVWLAELDAARRPTHSPRRAQIIAAAANLGGLGLGGLIAGVLAQWAGHPLTLPFLALGGLTVLALIAISLVPETHMPAAPRQHYRPQRVSVPPGSRARFFAAATAAAITFAIFGLITSLAPSFLSGTLHQPSRALAGAVSFAMFAAAAVAQTLTGARPPRQLLARAIPALLTGVGLLTLAVWLPMPSFGLFLAGDLVTGAGAGLMFKGAIGSVSEISLPERRAEALAGLYLAAYLGLAGPVIGLGALTQIASTRVSLLVFSGPLALGIFAAAPALLGSRGRAPRTSARPHPISH
jgi:MFS family permease